MNSLPELNDDAIIDVAREGGLAFIPKLSGPRRIALAQLDGVEREHVCSVLRHALPLGTPPEAGRVGQGDRRYFRVEVSYATRQETGSIVLLIPEEQASPELVQLWQEGR
ncbi:protealysin inhibitor emfourin [Erwinia sp. 9145]|uniref:protealysin inhibitor emfourin n=1 Tax=Erwinia sp. 9145 TaxID=1500895 RepID=UPI00055145D4|nr:protealysin inhibitor emfourin [Erwinia sp. 9145]